MWYMEIAATAVSPASTAAMWAAISDIRRWPDWLPTVRSVTPITPDQPDGAGSTYLVRQPRLPTARWTITDWRPGAGFTWVSRNPGVRTTATHEVSAADAGSRIALAIRWEGPLAPALRAVYGNLTRRYVTTEAETLVAFLGAGECGRDR